MQRCHCVNWLWCRRHCWCRRGWFGPSMGGEDSLDVLFAQELDRIRMLCDIESIEVFQEPEAFERGVCLQIATASVYQSGRRVAWRVIH